MVSCWWCPESALTEQDIASSASATTNQQLNMSLFETKNATESPGSIPSSEVSTAIDPLRPEETSSLFPNKPESPFVEDKDFLQRAKSFEPAVKTFIDVVDGAAYRALFRQAKRITKDEDLIEETLEPARIQKESKNNAAAAGGRILARRFKSSEAADIAVIVGVMGEMSIGYGECLRQLKRMEAQGMKLQRVKE